MLKKRYGPYTMKTGHSFWMDHYTDGSRKSVLVHRELMEKHTGRKLTSDEVVHHIDGDPTNNSISNLQIKTASDHARDHRPEAETVVIICPFCGKSAEKLARYVRHNQGTYNKVGPFCSKSCSGRWSRQRQISAGINCYPEIVHGTDNAYTYHKCKCVECRAAHAQKARRLRSSNA